jgi:hypothetical protein
MPAASRFADRWAKWRSATTCARHSVARRTMFCVASDSSAYRTRTREPSVCATNPSSAFFAAVAAATVGNATMPVFGGSVGPSVGVSGATR